MGEGSEDGAAEELLHPSSEDSGESMVPIPKSRKNGWLQVAQCIAPHAICWLAYTILFMLLFQHRTKQALSIQAEPLSPANHAMQWRSQVINSTVYEKSPYSGNPSVEVDEAWKDLLFGFNLRVSKDVLDDIGKTSIPLSDGSGYIAGLDTTHHLHCLWSIRHFMAPEYYATELKHTAQYKNPEDVYPVHIEHCMEVLRMQLMCRGDAALFTYAWDSSKREPLTDFAVEHKCSDWSNLERWALSNSFNLYDDLLVHPIYGKWPNGGPV